MPSAPHVNRDTSREAAESMESSLGRLQFEIYELFRAWRAIYCLGLTCDQIEDYLDLRHQTASARVRELAQKGLIVDSGVRRKTRSGRNAIVWIVAPEKGQGELF